MRFAFLAASGAAAFMIAAGVLVKGSRLVVKGVGLNRTRIGILRIAPAPDRSFTVEDRSLLRDAAEHVSLMVRRMQLHEQEHRIAAELQRGLLPTSLPQVPGLAIAADGSFPPRQRSPQGARRRGA